MPITTEDKLHLLADLLQNQASEQYMTTDEAEQIQRLISTLSTDPNLQPILKETLSAIEEKHQLNHQPFAENDVIQWINVLNVE